MSHNAHFNHTRRGLLLGAVAAGLAASPLAVFAQGLSNRPVRFLLAQTPGTTPDFLARILAPRLQARWNQPVVVENRVGASGVIGMEALARSAPDGHTININTSSTLMLPFFFKVSFDVLNSFIPITMIGSNIFALTVHDSVPAKNAGEFIAWAKREGARVNYGSPGNGTQHHMFMEQLKLQTGLQMTHIPYKGSAQAFTDLMGGQISAMMMPMGAALAMSKDGKLRILAGTGRDRSPLTPDIPSLHEQGVTDFHTTAFFNALAPAGTPSGIIAKYNAVFHAILAEPETRAALGKQGVSVQTSTPEEADHIARAEFERVTKLIKEINFKAD